MNKEIKILFTQAESFRTDETRKMSHKELCDTMAEKAGWHTVYTPSNKSKIKDKVHYERPFDNSLFFELLCRFKTKIIQQFSKTECLDHDTAPDKVLDCIMRFMNTYSPEKTVSNAQVTSRMLLSIRQRAIECNFEEKTRNSFDSSRLQVKLNGKHVGWKVLDEKTNKVRYESLEDDYTPEDIEKIAKETNVGVVDWRCRVQVSLSSTMKVGKNCDEKKLEDYIEDTNYQRSMEYKEDLQALEETYTKDESQKILLRILVDLGASRQVTPNVLLKEYIAETGEDRAKAKEKVFSFYTKLRARLLSNMA